MVLRRRFLAGWSDGRFAGRDKCAERAKHSTVMLKVCEKDRVLKSAKRCLATVTECGVGMMLQCDALSGAGPVRVIEGESKRVIRL